MLFYFGTVLGFQVAEVQAYIIMLDVLIVVHDLKKYDSGCFVLHLII